MKEQTYIFVKVFDYIESLDAYYPTETFRKIIDNLEISAWSWVEWIERFFALDNGVGEHWSDNWDLREAINEETDRSHGYYPKLLFVIDP